MLVHSLKVALVPLALTLVSVCLDVAKARAQTTFPFDTFYDTEVRLEPITPFVSRASISGINSDAPYGLTNFESVNYSQFNPTTGVFTFVPDAAQFGLEGLPIGLDEYFGNGEDRLFGISNAIAIIDSTTNTLNGSGTVTITGGRGRFSGATGILSFSESEPLDQDPTAPLRGRAFLSGSFQVPQQVPEPTTTTALVGLGVTGVSFLLRRRRHSTR